MPPSGARRRRLPEHNRGRSGRRPSVALLPWPLALARRSPRRAGIRHGPVALEHRTRHVDPSARLRVRRPGATSGAAAVASSRRDPDAPIGARGVRAPGWAPVDGSSSRPRRLLHPLLRRLVRLELPGVERCAGRAARPRRHPAGRPGRSRSAVPTRGSAVSAAAHPLIAAVLDAMEADPAGARRLADHLLAVVQPSEPPPQPPQAPAYTVTSLASHLGVTPKSVRGMISRGELAAVKRSGRWIVSASAVEAWSAGGEAASHPMASPRSRRPSRSRATTLTQAVARLDGRR